MWQRTRQLIEEWATKSGIDPETLAVERIEAVPEGCDYEPNSVMISVIYDGALDEEFVMDDLYAVNVVDDVLAPDCWRECAEDPDHPDFQILVTRVSNEHGDLAEPEQIYRYDSSTQSPPF
jgi:hypothetical protein